MSGTSMAAPHGAIANLLSVNLTSKSPDASASAGLDEKGTKVPRDPAGMKQYLLQNAGVASSTTVNATRGQLAGVLWNGY
ncbi:hypothetical protein HDU86_003798 [Geranomyces michiganensis]|nr:hypothetical protein HDU86_003798 [Geranomyces michiganensis]